MTDEQTDKLLAKAEQEWANQLPSWASRLAKHGELVIGTQLPTRDGRKVGNAWVVDTNCGVNNDSFKVLTDAGSSFVMNEVEIFHVFHLPKYVGRIGEIMVRFGRGYE